MNIGFDAKRAYHNGTGLGQYSRTLISSLAEFYSEHDYYLFNTKKGTKFNLQRPNIHQVLPAFPVSLFSSLWRSSLVKQDLKKNNIDVYHGLSHEIPLGIKKTSVRSVVTIHDLIHERYPWQYNPIDVKIYRRKFKYACENADKIIAISNQTKNDIIEFYKIPEDKIIVCYQSCKPIYSQQVEQHEKQLIKKKYQLPDQYFLYVGSIIERKNLLTVCKALLQLKHLKIPLIVIGNGGKYKQKVQDFIKENNMENVVIFLSEKDIANNTNFINGKDFPEIYQSAIAMIYPSIFEGFGIPVLEALFSKLPVITSNVSSLPEAGGDGAYYIDPTNAEQLAEAMENLYKDEALRISLIEKGIDYAQNFTPQKCAARVMDVYKSL